jgi:hypothetical protein
MIKLMPITLTELGIGYYDAMTYSMAMATNLGRSDL